MKPISRELAAYLAPTIMRTVKTDRVTHCWIRTSRVNPVTGYSVVSQKVDDRIHTYYAHRVMWVFWNGEIPEELTIDHLCERQACCNPAHLRLATLRDNILRSQANPTAINARKADCLRGHPLEFSRDGKRRYCPTCRRLAYHAKKAAS